MSPTESLIQQLLIGLTNGSLIALIAIGYSMVYGIIELINFAHGDLFMLGCFLALTLVALLGLDPNTTSTAGAAASIALMIAVVPIFCATLNVTIDRVVYRPLRHAPRLTPLVSAIGVSFILQNLGLLWGGVPIDQKYFGGGGNQSASPKNFPALISAVNLLGGDEGIRFTRKDLMVVAITVPMMVGIWLFVKYTRMGKAMRATAQNPVAAQLMGIDVNRVISVTFAMGGALAGVASVVYCLYINSAQYQMGYTNGLYAFTAAVLGGIGSIPGAVLGGLLIGVIRALAEGNPYVPIGAQWSPAIMFGILIVILVFRPSGLLGSRAKEKV